jgi:biopolymer transport protein ExbD
LDFSEEQIVDELNKRKANNPMYRVVIRADKAVPALEIQKAMTIIGQAGIDDISFSTLNQE